VVKALQFKRQQSKEESRRMNEVFLTAVIAIFSQVLFLCFVYQNFRYAIKKHKKDRSWYRPPVALIIPCKGVDSEFEKNIESFYTQAYSNYLLWFVVADTADAAYGKLQELKTRFTSISRAKDVRILTSGRTQSCSQKIHNLLYCYRQLPPDIEIMAFADTDASTLPDWLSHIVYPLRNAIGAAGGYRWFVPKKNNLASLVLSAMNAKVAQLLGNSPFNQAWGGSMAIRVETFRKLGLDRIWAKAISDDLSLTVAVKKGGQKIAYVPACLVATYQQCSFSELFEFSRRQFLITRINRPAVWWFGLLGSLYSVAGQWIPLAVIFSVPALKRDIVHLLLLISFVFFAGEIARAILRQKMALLLLKKDRTNLTAAAAVDIAGCWLWTILNFLLIISSAFGRTICWRGLKYKLIGPEETIVIDSGRKSDLHKPSCG
jgi:ceramide glucosyltransferase